MNLRLRLIVAFFLLSVVPLGAVTFYTYVSNAAALREAAGHEAELLAGDLTRRMQLVTSQLSDRVAHLMEVQRAAEVASTRPSPPRTVPAASTPSPSSAAPSSPHPAEAVTAAPEQNDTVAEALGEVAMLLNNIQVRGMRGGRPDGRRGPPPESTQTDGRGADPGFRGDRGRRGDAPPVQQRPQLPLPGVALPPPALPTVAAPAPASGTDSGLADAGDPSRGAANRGGNGRRSGGDPNQPGAAPGFDRGGRGGFGDRQGRPGGPPPGDPPPATEAEGKDRISFDMMPIRREIIQQLMGTGTDWQTLSPEERQRIIGEVNQRMLGIVQGIEMGAAELQKKVSEAQKAADAKRETALAATATERRAAARAAAARAAAAPAGPTRPASPAPPSAPATTPSPAPPPPSAAPPTPAVRVAPTRRRTALSGSRLDVTVERNGEVLREANAEVNLPNLLATVFTTTRRERGEVPFAVAKDGRLYTPTDDDRKKVEAIGSNILKQDAPLGTTVLPDWIVVTNADPTGSGLKFGIASPVGESISELRRAGARNAGLGLACIGLALIGIVPLSSRLTRHLSTLSDGVRRIAQGDYTARVEVGTNDEVGRLARAFNQMAEDVERHQHAMVEQERIRRELELGRQIQHDMLPHGPLTLGLTEIKGVSVPAREVGGDFFNYFVLSDGEVALLVGDVSGKGVGAALLMANIQASLRTRFALGQDLAAIAREIDLDIEGNTPGPVYATLFIGMLDPVNRVLRYVNAGHNPQYILRRDGDLEHMSSSGLPVGLLAGRGYAEARVQLFAGDLLFFYTDGCVEAENEDDEMFGAERLERLLKASAGSDDLLARVETVVRKFRGSREPFDDATMMVVKIG